MVTPSPWHLWLFEQSDDVDPLDFFAGEGLDSAGALAECQDLFVHSVELLSHLGASGTDRLLGRFLVPDGRLSTLLSDPGVSLLSRLETINAMGVMYETLAPRLEAQRVEGGTLFLWWDELFFIAGADSSEWVGVYRAAPSDRRAILDRALSVLGGMMHSDCRLTVEAAIHGLGHLAHPLAPDLLSALLASRRHWLSAVQLAEYAESARRREIL